MYHYIREVIHTPQSPHNRSHYTSEGLNKYGLGKEEEDDEDEEEIEHGQLTDRRFLLKKRISGADSELKEDEDELGF